MAVYKDGDKWRVIYRYTNFKGERKQTQNCNQILHLWVCETMPML